MKNKMHLLKTTQLNIDDILGYLNHSHLAQEKL